MEQEEPGCMEFLDLNGVNDQERNLILTSLYSWNPNIQLPWVEEATQPQQHVYNKQPKYKNLQPNAPEINQHDTSLYLYETYLPNTLYNSTTNVQDLIVTQPEPSTHQTEFVLNSSNIMYNNEYTNTNLEVQGYNDVVLENNFYDDNAYDEPVEIIVHNGQDVFDPSNNQINNIPDTNNINNKPLEVDDVTVALPQSEQIINEGATPPARKSWASLFNKSKSSEIANNGRDYNSQKSPTTVSPFGTNSSADFKHIATDVTLLLKEPFKSNADDPNLHRMGEFLSAHEVDNRITSLQPRGLINRSNYCYINSILQAILACPPMYNLLMGLSQNTSAATEKKKITPTIDSMTKFIKEFHLLPAGMRVGRRLDKSQKKEHNLSINCDTPFEPFWIHKLLSGIRSDTFVVEGRQEDAEEFLGCLLNGLNDEMLELIKLVGGYQAPNELNQDKTTTGESEKEWQVMGPKNKGAITRRTEFSQTPVSDIFGGLLRSRLHRAGDQSTDNIQPFFTLQLNIEKTTTVRDALEALACKNQLEGVTSSKTNEEVEAWQQVTIEELPIVLVLHLKCFDYKLDGCSKINKALEFPVDLKIDTKLLSSKMNYSVKEKQYKLFAVVYHEGKEATKGHYLTDAYHVGYASWLRYDDASIKPVPEEHVLKPHGTRVPYLLFYRRSDALNKK